jgi:murein L,D-transpeptidase YafK
MRMVKAIPMILVAVLAAGAVYWSLPETPLPSGTTAERLQIDKGARRLVIFADGRAVKSYRISLGRVPEGAKEREGDGRTPEGVYIVDYRKADSDYHRALHISYPDPYDRKRARDLGVSPGGAIMIHGLPNGLGWIGRFHRFSDWTQGCIAVTDKEIEELWRAVPPGTPVEIRA